MASASAIAVGQLSAARRERQRSRGSANHASSNGAVTITPIVSPAHHVNQLKGMSESEIFPDA